MDMLSVASAVSASTPQATVQSQGLSKAEGSAPFQQQLTHYMNQGNASTAVDSSTNVNESAAVMSTSATDKLLSSEELLAMIEGLIEQLEQLNDTPLTDENVASLEAISLQLLALMQLIAPDQKELSLIESYSQVQPQVVNQASGSQLTNDVLYKLQDQLLLLQQALKDGNLRVVQGQEPQQLVNQVLQHLDKLVAESKMNAKEQLIMQLASQAETEELPLTSLRDASLEQLKQLAKQSEYAQLANQAQNTATPTTALNSETTPVASLQHAVPLDAQLPSATSLLKAQPQAPAFTMVNQFADTVKTMVLQKFDLVTLNGMNEARIMLTPEHLGSVDIKLSMQNGVLTAVFQAETAMAKDALENQMSVLRSALAAQGITVERLEVTQASFAEELNWQEQRQREQATHDAEEESEHDEAFKDQLEATSLIQELGFGRSVNEMA